MLPTALLMPSFLVLTAHMDKKLVFRRTVRSRRDKGIQEDRKRNCHIIIHSDLVRAWLDHPTLLSWKSLCGPAMRLV